MLEEEILAKAAKDIADEIDWCLLAGIYLDNGWIEVNVENYTHKYRDGMADWIFKNIKGRKTGYKGRWLFERASDATWFRLMWSA